MALSPDEYRSRDATALAELVRDGEVSAIELTEVALREIERLQPELNALVWQDFDRARKAAGKVNSNQPFAGVPLLLKDTAPHHLAGAPTAEGCDVHRHRVMEHNSHLVNHLLDAGFVIPGRTNVPEFCLKATTEPRAFGATRNPWDGNHIPGGSSGGSAAAVASGMVPLATASDGGGSIRIPAAYCGLFGLKPSRGRVSQGPHLAETWNGLSCDHVLTRTVRDSAAVLDVIAGPAPGDPYGIGAPPASFAELAGRAPGPLRIGFSTTSPLGGPVHPDHIRAVQDTARQLEALGHRVEEAEPAVDGHRVAACYLMVYFGHVAAQISAIRSEHGDRALTRLEPDTLMLGLLGETYSASDYVRHQLKWNDFSRAVGDFFSRYDLYLTPTTAHPPARVGEQDTPALEALGSRLASSLRLGRLVRASGQVTRLALDSLRRVPFTQLANFCGTPAMSVPLGRSEQGRLPCGVQFMGARGDETVLLQLATQLETEIGWDSLVDI